MMKRLLFFITIFIFLICNINVVFAEGESAKVMALNYDTSSAIINIATSGEVTLPAKYVRLSNPNRVYFDINNAVLIGEKQQLVFEKSNIKEIRLAQFGVNPDIVRVVITFEEDFDTSAVKLIKAGNNIIAKIAPLQIGNNYFNPVYSDNDIKDTNYSNIVVNSQVINKIPVTNQQPIAAPKNVVEDIQRAFGNSTLQNSDGKTYDSVISIDKSSILKLRTKYFINNYEVKQGGLLVSGLGQLTTSKILYLNSPKRFVIDLPDTFINKRIRNKEVMLCPNGTCKDTAKIGQFEFNKARVVITSDKADKYIPVFSEDAQSLYIINSDNLNHTTLSNTTANLGKVFVKNIDSKTDEMILSFTAPVVYTVFRTDDSFRLFLFNVKSYNEQELIKTLSNSLFNKFTMSLLPQIGVRGAIDVTKTDIVNVEQSIDARALKITIRKNSEEIKKERPVRKGFTKGKVVLDAGHGGSDYGAIREGINEKDINLDVVKRVNRILRSNGYKTVLTRSDDTFVSLEDRVTCSEDENPEIFVSIHVNSAVSTEPKGVETHYYHEYSKELADVVHKSLAKEIKTTNRGLFKSKFYVINHTTAPAILIEIGFLSNEEERNDLISESRKEKTAKAIAEGIMEYLKKSGGKK